MIQRKVLFVIVMMGILNFGILPAQELVQNGSFESGLEGWGIGGRASFDKTDKIGGVQSLKVTTRGKEFGHIIQKIRLEPNTEYELNYYVKGTNLIRLNDSSAACGPYVTLDGGGKKRFSYGSRGLFKFDYGTFPWRKVTVRFNSKQFGNAPEIKLLFGCPNTKGTFWLDEVSLKKVNLPAYNVTLFPINFLRDTNYASEYSVAENLIGTIFLTSTRDPGRPRFLHGTKSVMTLDLPEFLRLAGAVDRFIIQRKKGQFSYGKYVIAEKKITRDGQSYRRYTIHFDDFFAPMLGVGYYYQKIFLQPEEKSAGKKGKMYWSFNVGGFSQKESSFPVVIASPIPVNRKPCKRFAFNPGYSSVHHSPFKELRPIMNRYWKSLTERLYMRLNLGEGSESGCRIICNMIGDDVMFDTPNGRIAAREYVKKAPANIKVSNQKSGSSPSWYKVDDPDKLYENYLRKSVRQVLKDYPEVKRFEWDYEPERGGYDPEGRARFARVLKLEKVPSIDEILEKYRSQWKKYTLKLNAEFIAKTARIIKEEAPHCEIALESVALQVDSRSGWCDVDMKLLDSVPEIDLLVGMPYITGAVFFDEISYNTRTLKKPMEFDQDPSERLWFMFKAYTPKRLYQNIIAVAALGGKGIGHWPDDSMTAEYYKMISDAYSLIACYEDVYFDGKRVDKKFTMTPLNVVSKKVTDGEKQATVSFPDFQNDLRMTVHEYKNQYYFTIFNYNEKEPVIIRLEGCGKSFLASVPAGGAKVIEPTHLEDQSALQKKLEDFRKNSKSTLATLDLSDGKNSAYWTIGTAGKPILRLANAFLKADIDALQGGELVGLKQRSNSDPFAGGAGARLIFYDSNQPNFSYRLKNVGIENGSIQVSFEAEVPKYEGAVPYENPLYGLRIFRIFQMTEEGLKVTFKFFNPTKKEMQFGCRIWNYPQTGTSFGRKNLCLQCGSVQIYPSSKEQHDFVKNEVPEFKLRGNISRYVWKGEKAVSCASDGKLKEVLEFIPDHSFAGMFVWNSQEIVPGHTVEFKTPVIRLAPKNSREFSYLIR